MDVNLSIMANTIYQSLKTTHEEYNVILEFPMLSGDEKKEEKIRQEIRETLTVILQEYLRKHYRYESSQGDNL